MKLLVAISGLALIATHAVGDGTGTPPPRLSLTQIVRAMDDHDQVMQRELVRYTCLRRYALENRRFHKKAEISVRMTCVSPGHKTFEVLSEHGSALICQRVLKPMLDAEEEAGRDDVRPQTRIVAANYDFKLLGTDSQKDRPAYLLEVRPKTRNKFLIRGRVWVDAQNFGIIRIDASPAQNPSRLIHNTRVIQESERFGQMWLPRSNHSNTDSFLFGHTEVTIDSWDYQIVEDPIAAGKTESSATL